MIPLDDLPIALLVVQRDYQIVVANKQCHILFGYDHGELIGKNMDVLVPPKFRKTHHQAAEEYWKDVHPKQLGVGRDLHGLKKDGVLIPVEVGLYPYNKEGYHGDDCGCDHSPSEDG